jgi:hypothetical protein
MKHKYGEEQQSKVDVDERISEWDADDEEKQDDKRETKKWRSIERRNTKGGDV